MQARRTYIERHNQIAGITYRNNCSIYGLGPSQGQMGNSQKIVENKAKILFFSIQTCKMLADQPNIVLTDKNLKLALVINITIPCSRDRDMSKKEYKKL